MVPASSILFKDFIDACSSMDSQVKHINIESRIGILSIWFILFKKGPQIEAAFILATLCGFCNYYTDTQILYDDDFHVEVLNNDNFKDSIVLNMISFNAECDETNTKARFLYYFFLK